MRVIFTHYFTDDTCRFLERLVRCNAETAHSVKDSSVYRLESVPNVRKRSSDDYTHGVIDVGVLHFVMDLMLYHFLIFNQVTHLFKLLPSIHPVLPAQRFLQ